MQAGLSEWRSSCLHGMRRTVTQLEAGTAANYWRGSATTVDEAHAVAADAYRHLAHYAAHGVGAMPGGDVAGGGGLPRDVRKAVGATRAALAPPSAS